MAKKSIGELHAKVTADATQFVDEFKRADNASRRSSTAINAEVDKLTKGIKKKFELADVGKDILKGAGLFGGFQIAETAAAAIVGHYKEAADAAKRIEDSTARQLANTLAMIRERRSAQEEIAFLSRDIASNQAKIDALNDTNYRKFKVFAPNGTESTLIADLTPAQKDAIAALTEEIQSLTAARKRLSDTVVEAAEKERAAIEAQKTVQSAQRIDDALSTYFGDVARETENSAQRIDDALSTFFGDVARETENSAQRIDDALSTFFGDVARESEQTAQRVDDALTNFFGDVARESKSNASAWSSGMAQMWENVADRAGQSFADILISGENTFGSLVDVVARSVVEMAARLAIINPLINSLFGLSGAALLPAFYGAGASIPGRAMGGGVDAGVTYRVNEQGQEFFKSNTGGTIIPAGISASMTERERGGDSYSFNYSFATGITRAELGPLLALNQRQTLAQLADIRRRGGAPARAY